MYDVIIIGAGAGGLTAGIYGKRAGLSTLILQDKYSTGSQICYTYEVCNYPGLNNISGEELYNKFKNHAKELNVDIKDEKVIEIIDFDKPIKKVKTIKDIYETKTIILASGAHPKKGGFKDEEKFIGRGVSYCATCDGAFYKDKEVAVVGGGNVAVEDAIFMSRIAKKVYLIVRRNVMRADMILQEETKNISNIEILFDTVVDSIVGTDKFEGVMLKSKNSNITSELSVDGIFVGIGIDPDTNLLKDKVILDNDYIVADETCASSIKGIYAVGDVRKKQLRQVITACADGANAITSIQKYLTENK